VRYFLALLAIGWDSDRDIPNLSRGGCCFRRFFRLLDAVPGTIAQILDAFANVLSGLFWFVVKAPNKIWLALRRDNRKSATERLLLSKPRTIIYFAKCLLCSERYENSVASEARRLRAEHMQRTHGIYDRETVSDARALPQ